MDNEKRKKKSSNNNVLEITYEPNLFRTLPVLREVLLKIVECHISNFFLRLYL